MRRLINRQVPPAPDVIAACASLDLYACRLFEDERDQNPRTEVDRSATWLELTREDRDEYRALALALVGEYPE